MCVIGVAKLHIFFDMKYFEILKFSKEIVNRLKEAGYIQGDQQYIEMFDDFEKMRQAGEKVTYIVAILAGQYNVSERKVYDIIRRFQKDCNSFAAESSPF